ncbi:unnamed protein product [Leptosia nina]|uniref:Uncharacterized protein n=1 Tax=Leptosia nina TaxID=320188 RepID=A0AAV1JJG1_9NEOP
MAGNPLRPLQGGSSRTTLLREPRKLVSRTRTEERQVEGGGSSRELRVEAARREVGSAAPAHGGVTISGTSGGRSSMPLPRQRSHRKPPCSDASRCSHSSTALSNADADSSRAIAVFCIDARLTPLVRLIPVWMVFGSLVMLYSRIYSSSIYKYVLWYGLRI